MPPPAPALRPPCRLQARQWDAPSSSSSWQPLGGAPSSSSGHAAGGYSAAARSGEWDEEPLLFCPDLDTPPVVRRLLRLGVAGVQCAPSTAAGLGQLAVHTASSRMRCAFAHMHVAHGECRAATAHAHCGL